MFNPALSEFNLDFFNKYIANFKSGPYGVISTILDILIVVFFLVKFIKYTHKTRIWQLLKGIIIVVGATILSDILKFSLLNSILSQVMSYGIILLLIVFQPELRRALEQIGTTSRYRNFFGLDSKDLNAKTKENVYRVAIAALELSKQRKGALIVFERDIKLSDIIANGIALNADISPQLLVNIFEPNTPLHDGAVIISNNKIAAASCMLPLADDKDIARELGTRHRSAIGISKETDALVVVVSEETGKISIAKDGTLIADLREDVLKKILLKYLITDSSIQKIKSQSDKKDKEKVKDKEQVNEIK